MKPEEIVKVIKLLTRAYKFYLNDGKWQWAEWCRIQIEEWDSFLQEVTKR